MRAPRLKGMANQKIKIHQLTYELEFSRLNFQKLCTHRSPSQNPQKKLLASKTIQYLMSLRSLILQIHNKTILQEPVRFTITESGEREREREQF